MKKLCRVLTVCCALASGTAWAWGDAGHKTVGAIADRLLENSNAGRHVDALLLPGENLAQISVWADCVKGSYCGPLSAEMTEYINANPKHFEYHYTDVPFQHAVYRDGAVGTRDIDIVQTLKQAIAVLQGKTGDALNPHRFTPRQALLLIAHLVGDIHQPLHVGAAYMGKDGRFALPENAAQIDARNIFDTRGGNDLLLEEAKAPVPDASSKPKREGKALHFFWDVTVVDDAMRRMHAKSPEEFAQLLIARRPNVPANTGDPADWPYQWANEALAMSKQAHAGVVPGDRTELAGRSGETYPAWFVALPENYAPSSSALAENQIAKGGYRFAALLKAIWP